MKKEELEQLIAEIESQRGNGSCTYSTETVSNEQVKLNKLYVRLINEFNETTGKYNCWLVRLTWAIALLTLVMVIKLFI
jgi:hypothetical protein